MKSKHIAPLIFALICIILIVVIVAAARSRSPGSVTVSTPREIPIVEQEKLSMQQTAAKQAQIQSLMAQNQTQTLSKTQAAVKQAQMDSLHY